MCSLCLNPSDEGLLKVTADDDPDTGVVLTGEVSEVSADNVSSPGDDIGDSDSGEGEWSLLGPGDNIGSLRDWSEELALSIPAISALCTAFLLLSFLNKLLFFLRLSASRRLGLFLAWLLLAILMLLGSLLRPPVLMLVFSRAVALMVTASPPLTRSWSTWVW